MFCIKCGNKIADDSTFCDECCAEVEYENQLDKLSYNNKTLNSVFIISKAIIIAPILVIVLVIGTVIFNVVASTGENYLYKTILRTNDHYTNELNAMKKSNNVLKNIDILMNKSYMQSLNINGSGYLDSVLQLNVGNNKKDKIISMKLNAQGMPAPFESYITDKYIIGGSPKIMYVKANAKDVYGDLKHFFSKNSLDNYEKNLTYLKNIDLSYSNIENMRKKVSKEQTEFYLGIFKSFVEDAEYKKEKSKIEINNKDEKCTYLTLSMDGKKLSKWINKKLIPKLEQQKANNNLNYLINQNSDLTYYFKQLLDYLDMFDDSVFTCGFYVYKDVIVGVDLSVSEANEDIFIASILAKGKKYRLNDIEIKYKDKDSEMLISLLGDHIGNSVMSSTIKSSYSYNKDKSTESTMFFKWDTEKTKNNFILKDKKTNKEIYNTTIATDHNKVMVNFKLDDYLLSYTLEPLEDKIQLPKDTTSLRDLKSEDLIAKMNNLEGLRPDKPQFNELPNKPNERTFMANHRVLISCINMYVAEHDGKYPNRLADLKPYLRDIDTVFNQAGTKFVYTKPKGNQDQHILVSTLDRKYTSNNKDLVLRYPD